MEEDDNCSVSDLSSDDDSYYQFVFPDDSDSDSDFSLSELQLTASDFDSDDDDDDDIQQEVPVTTDVLYAREGKIPLALGEYRQNVLFRRVPYGQTEEDSVNIPVYISQAEADRLKSTPIYYFTRDLGLAYILNQINFIELQSHGYCVSKQVQSCYFTHSKYGTMKFSLGPKWFRAGIPECDLKVIDSRIGRAQSRRSHALSETILRESRTTDTEALTYKKKNRFMPTYGHGVATIDLDSEQPIVATAHWHPGMNMLYLVPGMDFVLEVDSHFLGEGVIESTGDFRFTQHYGLSVLFKLIETYGKADMQDAAAQPEAVIVVHEIDDNESFQNLMIVSVAEVLLQDKKRIIFTSFTGTRTVFDVPLTDSPEKERDSEIGTYPKIPGVTKAVVTEPGLVVIATDDEAGPSTRLDPSEVVAQPLDELYQPPRRESKVKFKGDTSLVEDREERDTDWRKARFDELKKKWGTQFQDFYEDGHNKMMIQEILNHQCRKLTRKGLAVLKKIEDVKIDVERCQYELENARKRKTKDRVKELTSELAEIQRHKKQTKEESFRELQDDIFNLVADIIAAEMRSAQRWSQDEKQNKIVRSLEKQCSKVSGDKVFKAKDFQKFMKFMRDADSRMNSERAHLHGRALSSQLITSRMRIHLRQNAAKALQPVILKYRRRMVPSKYREMMKAPFKFFRR